MRRSTIKNRMDYPLFFTVIVMAIFGLIMIYSATFAISRDPFHYLKLQALWFMIGFAALLIMSWLDYQLLQRLALPIMGLAFLSLLAVLLIGRIGGNAQWLLDNRRIQPSEFAKLAFIIYIAAWLASKGDKIRDVTYGLIPFAILLGAVTGLIILQPDLGTAILIVVTAISMFFIAGAEVSQLIISLLVGIPTLCVVILGTGYARDRIQVFLHPERDIQGAGYQVYTVITALRTGGILGKGLGAGVQKLNEPFLHHTDTIFAVVGEELGLIGCLVFIGLFLFIAYRGLLVSFRAPDSFGTLLALGITCWISFQAIVHMGVNTATLPFTGLTLPFVSYGGSSLVSCMAGVGVLLSISRMGREPSRHAQMKGRVRPSAAFTFGGRNRRPRLSRARRR